MQDFHILVIDDSPADVFLHRLVFAELDLADHVIDAEHGAAALELLRAAGPEHLPRLILVDLNMPVMDGWEFLEQYEKEFGHRKDWVVVAVVSTSNNPRDIRRSEDHALVSRYLEKPLEVEGARQLIEDYLPDVKLVPIA